jgi:hypothetical protein
MSGPKMTLSTDLEQLSGVRQGHLWSVSNGDILMLS